MELSESKNRQEKLKGYLQEMSTYCMNETQTENMVNKLLEVYADNFRHNYSEFFAFILEIEKIPECNLDFLCINLEQSRLFVENDYLEKKNKKEKSVYSLLYRPLMKLSDHINLEIGRYSYYSQNEQKMKDLYVQNQQKVKSLNDNLEEADKLIKKLKMEIEENNNSLKDAIRKMASVQTELVAVLSIFAAIVLTFSGSISFIGNALSGLAAVPLYKSAFFVILCGLIFSNAIFLMLYVVGKITGRNIYARCESPDCSCDVNKKPKCSPLQRVRKRLPYIFWLNILFLILLVLDVVFWYVRIFTGLICKLPFYGL